MRPDDELRASRDAADPAAPSDADADQPLSYSTGTYRAPRKSVDTEPVYLEMIEALALLRRRGEAR